MGFYFMHACVPVPMSYEAPLGGPWGRGAPLIGNANIQTIIKIKKGHKMSQLKSQLRKR